jgi:hypothetical protein
VLLEALGDRAGAQPVGYEREHGAALALLRLREWSEVMALIGDYFGEADAHRPDRRREGPGRLAGPAVRGTENVRDPLVRLRFWRRAPG